LSALDFGRLGARHEDLAHRVGVVVLGQPPLLRLTLMVTTPGGGCGQSSGGCDAVAARIQLSQMGPATCPPVSSVPIISCVSKPTQAPATSSGVKPTNQPSR